MRRDLLIREMAILETAPLVVNRDFTQSSRDAHLVGDRAQEERREHPITQNLALCQLLRAHIARLVGDLPNFPDS